MTQAITDENTEDLRSGLSTTETDFLLILNEVSIILARAPNEGKAVEMIVADRSCSEDEAILWVQKAHDYMAIGCVEAQDQAREMYHLRLTQMYAICAANVMRDEVKVVSKVKRVVVEVRDQDGELIKVGREPIMVHETEVKKDVFNSAAVQAALKAAREAAHIMGGRPRDPAMVKIGQINTQVNNYPGAQQTQDLVAQSLAGLIGAEVVTEEELNGHGDSRISFLSRRSEEAEAEHDG